MVPGGSSHIPKMKEHQDIYIPPYYEVESVSGSKLYPHPQSRKRQKFAQYSEWYTMQPNYKLE